MSATSHRLSAEELRAYREDGYVIREGVFSAAELAEIIDECEALVERLVRNRQAERSRYGSYTFDADLANAVMIKWEGDTDVVHGLEPFAHLSKPLTDWAYDPRFVDPMRDMLNTVNPELFTEKLNLKRPYHGGVNPLHQDYPYWVNVAESAAEIVTAMLFLDAANLENGCLHVVPGSHLKGEWPKRATGDRFADNELDPDAFGELTQVPVEVEAGSLVLFGPLLVHQSAPNTSPTQRRALLYSYQPPGRRTQVDNLRRLGERAEG